MTTGDDMPAWVGWLSLVLTGGVALYGLTHRDALGERSWVHLLVGAVALVFFLRTLVRDILGVGF